MKTNSMILALVSALSITAGTARVAHAQEASAPTRGTVAVKAQGPKAVVSPEAVRAATAHYLASHSGSRTDVRFRGIFTCSIPKNRPAGNLCC